MARSKPVDVREVLTGLIPARRLSRLARELGAVVRDRKVKALALFWTLVPGFGAGGERLGGRAAPPVSSRPAG